MCVCACVCYAHSLLWWRIDYVTPVQRFCWFFFCLSGVAFPTAAAAAAPVEGRTSSKGKVRASGSGRAVCVARFASFLPLYITHYRIINNKRDYAGGNQ